MPIRSEKILFKQKNLAFVPRKGGVYGLYQGSDTIYYGKSDDSIRSRIESHMAGNEGLCPQAAMLFNWELNGSPSYRERMLLDEHRRIYGKLPRCNERLG